MNYIYGLNAVSEAIKARGRAFQWVGLAKERHDLRLQRIIEECRKLGVPVRFLQRTELDRLAGNAAHQGVVAVTSAKQYSEVEDVIEAKRGEYSLIVVLDGVEDPHNLGAILRTADAAGADGVVIPERRAAAHDRSGDKNVGGSQRASADREGHQHRAHRGRIEGENMWMVWLDERDHSVTTSSTTRWIAPSCLAPKARACTIW